MTAPTQTSTPDLAKLVERLLFSADRATLASCSAGTPRAAFEAAMAEHDAIRAELDGALAALQSRSTLAEAMVRDYQARMIAAGALICTPVSEKNLRDAKELLTPAYHDAARDVQARRATPSTSPSDVKEIWGRY